MRSTAANAFRYLLFLSALLSLVTALCLEYLHQQNNDRLQRDLRETAQALQGFEKERNLITNFKADKVLLDEKVWILVQFAKLEKPAPSRKNILEQLSRFDEGGLLKFEQVHIKGGDAEILGATEDELVPATFGEEIGRYEIRFMRMEQTQREASDTDTESEIEDPEVPERRFVITAEIFERRDFSKYIKRLSVYREE